MLAPPGPLESEAIVGQVAFGNGVVLSDLDVAPRVRPGEEVAVRFTVTMPQHLDAVQIHIGLQPPRDASRQVARGGPDAPPPSLAPDERARFVSVLTAGGRVAVTLRVPEPWHPRTAVLTARLEHASATRGPRTHAGLGVLGLVDVEVVPVRVKARRTHDPMAIDGRLDEPSWSITEATRMVDSLDGEPHRGYPSSVRWLWDDDALYVGAEIVDPDLRSSFRRQDDPLWEQEAFEVFVFGPEPGDRPRRRYLEFQVSPRGVTFDARFDQYRRGDERWDGAWASAVQVRGTVDDGRDRDGGYTVEVAFPWRQTCQYTEIECPVVSGDAVRINAFVLERPAKRAPFALALSPPRVPDFHHAPGAAIVELAP